MEIKVNVANEIRKLRDFVYSDPNSWVDELVQNTQRAGAKNVWITVDRDEVEVVDDGIGCEDPQKLFEKSATGWQGLEAQNPFGEGFFSVVSVAGHVEVESSGWLAVFDVKKIVELGDVDCVEVKPSSFSKGFRVRLCDMADKFNRTIVENRFLEAVAFVKGINFYLNGTKLVQKDLSDLLGDSAFACNVKREGVYEGWIRPFCWGGNFDGYDGDEISFYAQQRKVKDHCFIGVKGMIALEDGAVDLRAPDRREFIMDERAFDMLDAVRSDIKEMMLGVVRNGGDKDIDKYASVIDRYLSVDEYKHYLRFLPVGLVGIDKLLKADEGLDINNVDYDGELNVGDDVLHIVEEREESGEKVEDDDAELWGQKTGKELSEIGEDNNSPVFWVAQRDLLSYQEVVERILYYGLPVVVARNVMEEKVLDSEERFMHIKHYAEKCCMYAKLQNYAPKDAVEERAYWVLGKLSKALGFGENIFRIGDLEVEKEIKVGDSRVEVKSLPETEAVAQNGMVYIDRKYLSQSNLKPQKSRKITKNDAAWVASNIDMLADELAHVLYQTEDNTKEHLEAKLWLVNKLLKALY